MINLGHGDAAVWISLEEEGRDGDWVIAARQLQDGMIIQGGAEYAAVAGIYKKLRTMSWYLLLAAAAAAGLLTYYVRKKSRSSLLTAEQALQEILDKTSPSMLQEKSNEELARLYQLLNELISQNRQLIKEMQESLDNVAHDLRTPMTRLRSVAEYGLQKKDPEKLAEALSDCLEESERVLSMLGIMMSVAEAESGTMPLNREEVSLITTIEDVVTLYEYVADEKEITVEVEVDGSCVIKVDPMRIVQVWANIVDNAIKYGRVGGKVKISSQSNSDSVRIIFKDNGIGISAAEINKIWDRLFRGDRSRSEQGLGLGLNYVKAVIEAHGGSVSVSSSLGEGSVFSIELPLCTR